MGVARPVGYWQNPQWLLQAHVIKEYVLAEGVPTHARKEALKRKLLVHVRGTDFLRSPAHAQSRAAQKYIDAALDTLRDVDHGDVALVTDDLAYVRETFGTRYPVVGIEVMRA